MADKRTYADLAQRLRQLEQQVVEQRHSEQMLRDSEKRYRRLVNLFFDGEIICQEEKIVQINLMGAQVFGAVSPDGLINRPVLDLVHPADRGFFLTRMQQVSENRTGVIIGEQRFVSLNGQELVMEVAGIPAEYKGKPAIQMVFRDMTGYRRAEEDLQKLAMVVKNSRNFVCLSTLDGQMIFINEAGGAILGIDPDEVKGLGMMEILPAHLRPQVSEDLLPALKAGNPWEGDLQYRNNKTGGLTDVHAMAFPIQDPKTGKTLLLANVSLDITDKKQAEMALRESEERFRETTELLPGVVCEYDPEGRITYVNKYGLEILGFTPGDVGDGLNVSQVVLPEELATFKDRLMRLARGERVEPGEYRLKCKDGALIDVIVNSAPIYKSGRIVGVRTCVTPITALNRVEKALRQSENRFESIIRVAPIGIGVVSNRVFQTVNDRLCEMTQFSKEELVGRNARVLYPSEEEYARVGREKYKNISQTGTGSLETKFMRKDGNVIDVLLSSTALDLQDLTAGVIFTALDITERKKAVTALLESEDKFRTFFDFSPQAIALTDIASGRLVDINRKFSELTQYARDEIIGRSTTEIAFYAEDKRVGFIAQLKKEGEVNGMQMIFRIKDGSTRIALMFSKIIPIEGEPFILTIFQDITEQSRLQSQLAQAQRMEAIGTLAGGIAHDFNNILSPIIGYAELTIGEVSADSHARKNLNEILRASMRARDLVRQILTFSRQHDEELKPLKAHRVVEEALKLIRSSLPTTIQIRQNIDRNCGPILADPTSIHQVVMNLCTNAYHAMEETGGVLEMGLREISLMAEDLTDLHMAPGPYLLLTVRDTGDGMDQGVIAHIFDPYFSTKEKGKGTGLGLAVVYGIVKGCGGDIKVDSTPGQGSVFRVYLPLIQQADVPARTGAEDALAMGHERVLLVDDEEPIVLIEKQMLEGLGYHVSARTSSIEALAAFRKQPERFDLVITDMTMPNMTGDKLAKEIMTIRSDIPVIICTGFSERISRENIRALGIRGFLMKPIVMRDLARAVRDVLDHWAENES